MARQRWMQLSQIPPDASNPPENGHKSVARVTETFDMKIVAAIFYRGMHAIWPATCDVVITEWQR
jgi:hypothetical protein